MAPSRIFLYAVLAFLFGVLARSFITIPANAVWFLVFTGLCLIALGILVSPRRMVSVYSGIFLLAFCAGIFRFASAAVPPLPIAETDGTQSELLGVVWDEPVIQGQTQEFPFRGSIQEGGVTKPFFILVRTRPYPRYEIGTEVLLRGIVQKPEHIGTFDYAAYLAKNGISGVAYYPLIRPVRVNDDRPMILTVQKKLFQIKRAFSERLNAMMPEPHAAFLSGLLIGTRSDMPPDFLDALQKTGTMHLIALSGFNISIIADNLLRALQFLLIPFQFSFWIVVIFVTAFTVMTGASASLVRAAIMGILILIARKSGRLYNARLALIGAAGAMVFYQPYILRFDLGFQLSFLATLGIMFFTPIIEEFEKKYLGAMLAGMTAPTLGAQLAVLPLIVYRFGGISVISPFVNAAVLPVIPLTMLVGFCAVAVGFLSFGLGSVAALASWLLLEYEIISIQFFAYVPFSYIEPPFLFGLFLAAFYGWFLLRLTRSTMNA